MKRTATTPAPEPESGVSPSQQSIGKWVQLKVKTGAWKVTYLLYTHPCILTVLFPGLWLCLSLSVILIAGGDTVSGLKISLAASARSLTSERPEVGQTTAGKYSFGRSSNVIPTPYALTTPPMNEIKDRLWSLYKLLTFIWNSNLTLCKYACFPLKVTFGPQRFLTTFFFERKIGSRRTV